jgi:hypothetical protein
VIATRLAVAGIVLACRASAAVLNDDGDVAIRWDNTLRYSTAFRLSGPSADLLGNINGDDGDRAFSPGLISNRVDLLSQLDIAADGFGADVSGAGWYDTVYNQRNADGSGATFNPATVPVGQFTAATRDLDGRHVELLNGFVYGETDIAGMPLSVRLGRHTLLWGESLFFADNGIAYGQAPIDDTRGQGQDGAYERNDFLPVAQISANLRVRDDMAIEAYDQLEWRPTRLPGVGSYFSVDDYLGAGGERYITGPGQYFYRTADHAPPAAGQYGIALRYTRDDIDFGLYALRFNAKDPELYYRLNAAAMSYDGMTLARSLGRVGSYYALYPTGIALYGASASASLGDSTFGAELSGRRNIPLPSLPIIIGPGQAGDAVGRGLYPIGDTLNADLSGTTILARSRFWDSATLMADLAANWRVTITRNHSALDPAAKPFAAAFEVSFTPTYFAVLPHFDVSPRLAVAYDFIGDLSADRYRSQNEGAGEVEFGMTGTFRAVWSGSIAVTHYLGKAANQPLADRDFVQISVQRTF